VPSAPSTPLLPFAAPITARLLPPTSYVENALRVSKKKMASVSVRLNNLLFFLVCFLPFLFRVHHSFVSL
jgi:hypothetical protein